MSIIVKGGSTATYDPHPEGQYAARCVDVVDLGWMPGSVMYPDPKYCIRLLFYCGQDTEKDIDGETKTFPMLVMEQFTASLNEKSNLRKFCRSWKGKDFEPEVVRDGFDFELMVGAPAYIQVEHATRGEKTYANISSIMRIPEGQNAPDAPDDYVRVCDRDGWAGPNPHPAMSEPTPEPPPADDDGPDFDLPF